MTRYFSSILIKLPFSRQFFEKYSNTKFNEDPYIGSRVIPCGQTGGRTDGYDEADSLFSQFFELA
jgi:hypothetical protein